MIFHFHEIFDNVIFYLLCFFLILCIYNNVVHCLQYNLLLSKMIVEWWIANDFIIYVINIYFYMTDLLLLGYDI